MAWRRPFSTSSVVLGHRALIYGARGEPASVVRAVTFPALPPPLPNALNVRMLAAPVNPSDVNVVQGVYPARPLPAIGSIQIVAGEAEPVFVGGNEGVAEVVNIGPGVEGLSDGDWVLITKPQSGTWTSMLSIEAENVLRLKRTENLSATHASTLTVNPPTAWNMLHDFTQLSPGDFVLQNGANSAVGQNVIQICRSIGLKTINFVRSRDDIEALRQRLHAMGADHVLTYNELADKTLHSRIKEITGDRPIRLFLNCVGGRDTTLMAKLLGKDGHMVSYGGMSKQPISLPVSLHIFNNLTSHGFWQACWYETHSRSEREKLVDRLITLIAENQLHVADAEVITLEGHKSDAQITGEVQRLMQKMADGYSKKIILQIEDTVDVIEGSL